MLRHKEFFDKMADRWDETVYHDPSKLKLFFEHIDLKPGSRVLDVGTGTGVLIPYIYEAVGLDGKIYAIDLSEKMLKKAREKYPYSNVEYIQGDVMEYPVAKDPFDCILCYSVFPHFFDQERTVLHLAKGLKNGGKLVVCHSQSRDAINNLHRDAGQEVKKDLLPPMEKVAEMMVKGSLKVIKEIDNQEMFFIMGQK